MHVTVEKDLYFPGDIVRVRIELLSSSMLCCVPSRGAVAASCKTAAGFLADLSSYSWIGLQVAIFSRSLCHARCTRL